MGEKQISSDGASMPLILRWIIDLLIKMGIFHKWVTTSIDNAGYIHDYETDQGELSKHESWKNFSSNLKNFGLTGRYSILRIILVAGLWIFDHLPEWAKKLAKLTAGGEDRKKNVKI